MVLVFRFVWNDTGGDELVAVVEAVKYGVSG